MNIRLTNKDLRNNFSAIVSCGYCELQTLLSLKNRVGYNCGVYGWNFDAYDFGGVGLITGYRTRGADISLPLEFCEEWDNKARNATYEGRKQILNEFEKALITLVRERLVK